MEANDNKIKYQFFDEQGKSHTVDQSEYDGRANDYARLYPKDQMRMVDKHGQSGLVPAGEVETAIKQGYRPFTISYSAPAPISNAPLNSVQPIGQTMENKAREEQAQLQKPIQQIQKTVDKEFNSQPATVNLGKGNVPVVPTPIQPQKPLKDIISDTDKEFNTSIAPKIDSFISQHKNAALKEMRSDDGLLSANQYVGAMAAKAQRYMSEIDAQNVLNDVRNYIGQKTGNGKGGNGVDPHTDRIMQRTIDYLAKKDMPKSSVEYILKNMIDGSLVGTIGNAVLGKSSTQQEVEQRGNELYNPSWVEKGVAGAGAMALDAPIFGGLGGISSKAFKLGTKALTKHVARQLAEKAGEKVISKATLEQAGRIVSQNTPKMIAQRIGMNAAESASTLGMYNTADDAINQAIQINNGSQEKYSLKQTAKSGLSGILMGGAFGVTDGAFAGVSRNMTGLKRIGTEIGGLASSAAVGTGVSTLEKYAQGEPVDIGEDYLTNIAMFGAMKLPHVGNVNLKSVDPKDREILKSTLAFTPEQKGELKNAGYDANHLVSTIAQLSANKKQKAATVEGQRNVSLIEDSNRDRELFGKEYAKIMQNPDISLSTKSKILYLVEGKLAIQPAITGYKTSTDEKGETILTTNDWAGRTIDKKAFKNNKDANTYIQKNNLLDNSIRNSVAFSEQLNDRAVEGVYKRQAIRDIATKYGISSDDISKIIADKAEGKELPENGDKMLDEIKWTVESDPEFIKRTSAAKAQDVKDMTGVNVDDALKKNKAERTEDEEKAISMYADKLQNGFRTEEESKDDNIDSIFDSNKQIENTKEPTGDNIQQHKNENTTGNDAEEQILSNANKEGKILRVQTFGGDIVNVVDGHLEFDENGKVDLSKSDPEIYYKDQDGRTKVGSTEDTVSNLVDETDANELAAQAKQDAEDKQPIENSSEESPINTLVPIDKDQQSVSNEQEDMQTQPQENTQSYLNRIPKDNEGNPLFEQAEPENTAGALLEMNDGDNTEAIDTAKQMSSNYESEIKKLEKKAPTGKSVIEIQNAKRQKKDALAELQNLYDYWDGVSSLLEQTPTNQTAEPQTSTAEVNDQEYKEETLTDKPKRSRGFYSKENDDMGAPNSLKEAVIREIATGGYKFQWKDNENNKTKGLASHLGLKGDESERRGMIGFLSAPENGGLPPEVVAEKMRGDLGEMYPSATDQDIFNEILDVFHSYGGSRRSMWEEAKKLHGQTEEDDPEYKQYLEDIHQKIASSYHMTPEEYDLYNEYIPQKIEEENNTMTDNDYSDFLSTLAGQYNKEDNDSRRENIHGQLPEVETVQGNNGRSGPVLHGEENIHDEGYTNSEGSRQGGNAEPDKYNDNSLPDSKISGEPELTNKELEKEKDIFGKPSLDENKEVSLNQNNKNDGREIQQRTDEREPILQQIPQGEHGEVPERNGGLEQTTGELERRCRIYEAELSGSGKTLSVEERKEIERRTTEDFAKENGLWIPMDKIFDLGVPGPSGNENDTYISGNDIYKVNSLMNSGSIVSLLNKTLLHNKIFPNTKYDFVGFTGFDKRSVFPVLKQRLILDAVPASPQEIKSYMRSLGFKETGEAMYSNGKIIISDLYPRNVLKSENGNIYVIDDEIKEADSSFVSPEKKRDESILNYADRIAAAKELHDEENKVVTNPTDAQKEAGNYKKGHIKIDGFDITIENPKGSVRSGTDANGNKWETEIHNTYGYIRGTKGVDGDHIDMFLSDHPEEGKVYVVDQIKPDGSFDEHKVMYGFNSTEEAKEAYLSNYSKGWKGLGNITPVSKEEFKKWIDSSKRKTKPFAEYSTVKVDVSHIKTTDSNAMPQGELAKKNKQENNDKDKWLKNNDLDLLVDYAKDDVDKYHDYARAKKRLDLILRRYDASLNIGLVERRKKVAEMREYLYSRFPEIERHIAEQEERHRIAIGQMEASRRAEQKKKAEIEKAQLEEEEKQKPYTRMSADDLDKTYMDAVKSKDEEVMRRCINEVAMRKGYSDVESDYQGEGTWVAPSNGFDTTEERRSYIDKGDNTDVNIEDIADGYSPQADDYFSNDRAYSRSEEHSVESAHAINEAIEAVKRGEKPMVKIYRAVPTDIKESKVRNGDWVTPSRKYAEMHGNNRLEGKYRLIEQDVPANELYWDGNDVNEWGVDDGSSYRYKNTKNNRKLNDLITRDDKGNIILPSKRFNEGKSDIRFRENDKAINRLGIRQSNSTDDAIPSNSPTTANIIKDSKNPTLQDGKIMSAAEELAKTLNAKVYFINSEDIKGGDEYSIKKRNAKGWYDTKTDEVYINPQNNIDEEDVKQTILHEVVAHKGLRKLLGDSFDDTMNDIFRSLPESERKEISDIFLNSKSWDTTEAAEEYCALLAESGIDKPTIWKTIISKVRELLRKAGIKIKMSDNDIKYLLWKSRRHLEDTPDNYVKEFKVKDNIYKDDFVDNRKATPLFRLDPQKLSEKDFNDIIGITKEVATLNEEEQNDFIKRMEHQVLFESWIDKMNPIRVFQETVAKKYETEIPDECNAHLSYQTMTSRARYEKDTFKSIVFDKMLSAVNKVGEYDDVINYLIAKHGLERNVYMRKQKIEEAIAPLKEQITQIDYLLSRHGISEEEADAQRKSLENKIKKVATKITEDFANEDFAGLTQLQKELQDDDSDLKDIKLNEPYIQNFVDEFEKNHDKDDISDMWENIHEATNFCLETQRLYGCISKERMEQIKAMYNYYVPLRDWADPQAEDFFTYFYKDRHDLNIPIQKAKGRKTKAGDPIANIGSMADSAIVLGNKNRVKQHLYRLVFNYPTNLAHVSPVWVAWNPNTLTYEEVAFEGIDSKGNPLDGENYDTAFEEWNNRMKSLAKQNIVVQKNEKLSIGVPIKAWQAKQHQVRLTINGKDYIISMDSSPRVAQSINGDNIDEGMQAFQKLKNATNWMARNFTSKMINFVFRNFFRDYTGAITYNSIYGYSSMKDFLAATPKASKVLAEYLTTKKMPEGKYGGYLEEFLKNGGETGYTNSMSYKDYFKEIQNEISKVKHPTKLHLFRWIGNTMEILNRGAEDTTRLSAYIASRESGKSIMQSINAAKEISVNFNRMGSGRNGNSFIRAWEMFFNAGLQAVYNTVRGFKYHPVKSTIAFGTWTLIGAMKGIFQSIYGDDKYYQLPDWIRQNNFTISVGGDLLLNIPLALEIRPFFAMGDILAQVVLGKYHDKNAVTDIATKFMEAAPYNFMEGSNSKGDTFEQILANTLAPSAVKPLIDVYWTNKDYTGRPISKRNEFNEYVPEYKKGYRSTSDLAIAISKGINDLSGGDMAKKGALDSELTNPAVMEYLFNNYGGGVLKQIYGIAKSGYNLVTPGKDVDVRDIPAVSALLYKFDNSKGNSNVNERYYRYLDEYEENQSQDREYTKSIMSSEKGAVEHYFNKKANLENEKDMQIIGMYKKIIETIQQKAKSIPDGNESDQLQKQIYGLKKAMVEQLEK